MRAAVLKLPALLALSCAATRLTLRSSGFGYCRGLSGHRGRSASCDGQTSKFLRHAPIEEGQGVYLDGQCYDFSNLKEWLTHHEALPHNGAHFTTDELKYVMTQQVPFPAASLDLDAAQDLQPDASNDVAPVSKQTFGQPCDESAPTSKHRSAWCDGKRTMFLTFAPIRDGEGVCLDRQCYDASVLGTWLHGAGRLPHNGAPFTVPELDAVMGRPVPIAVDDALHYLSKPNFVQDVSSRGAFHYASEPTAIKDEVSSQSSVFTAIDALPSESASHISKVTAMPVSHTLLFHSSSFIAVGTLRSVAVGPGGLIATGTVDGTVQLWNGGTKEVKQLARFLLSSSTVLSLKFSPDGLLLRAASEDGIICAWDIETFAEVHRLELRGPLRAVEWSSTEGSKVVVASGTSIQLWDLSTVRKSKVTARVRRSKVSPPDYWTFNARQLVWSLAFRGSGIAYCTGRKVFTVKARDENSTRPLSGWSPWNAAQVVLAFSPDGARLLSGSSEGLIAVLDVRTGSRMAVFDTNQELSSGEKAGWSPSVMAAAWSPGGDMILYGTQNGMAGLYSITGRHLWRARFEGGVSSVDFSPDGHRLLIAGKTEAHLIAMQTILPA